MKYRLTSIIFTASLSIGANSQDNNRNILLIMADDMGAMELGCYGSELNSTPNFDALAESGIRFETFFATPVSTPSRIALMTGKYGVNTGHLNMQDKPGGIGREYDLSTEEYTVGQMFSDSGYRTAMAGKWQLSGNGKTLIHDCGFDEYMAWIYKGMLPEGVKYQGGYFPENSNKTSRYWHPGIMMNGRHIKTGPEEYGPDMYSDFLIRFMEDCSEKGEPFLAYYPMTLIHKPWVGTPDNPDVKTNSPEALKANVEYCDKIIGKMIGALERLGIRKNTLVIFIGDNGTEGYGKTTASEWGPRTPCIVSCPGTIPGNRISGELVDIPDILPTILDFAGICPDVRKKLDGKSLMPVLTGKACRHDEFAISYYGNIRIIRTQEWLLESNSDEEEGRLFYCGTNRSGIGYTPVDTSRPEARKIMRKFRRIIRSKSSETRMSDADKEEFRKFLEKNEKNMNSNLQKKYDVQDKFLKKKYASKDGLQMNYRILFPENMEPGRKYPLFIFLHGMGKTGNDNTKQLELGGKYFLDKTVREKYPCIVLYPQVTSDRTYIKVPKKKASFWPSFTEQNILEEKLEVELSEYGRLIKELICTYVESGIVDHKRIYISGSSMGAFSTYKLIAEYPQLFAAAAPIAGATTLEDLNRWAGKVPVKIYHGDKDNVVPVEASRLVVKILEDRKISNFKYVEFKNTGHGAANEAFDDPDFLEWFFSQHK